MSSSQCGAGAGHYRASGLPRRWAIHGNLRPASRLARIPVPRTESFDSRRIAMTLRSRRWATKLPFFLMAAALLCGPSPATGQELPEGKGKEIVAASCNSCHPFHARLGGGYTPEGWRTVMRMMANHGVVLPSDQLATVTEYLTKHFP